MTKLKLSLLSLLAAIMLTACRTQADKVSHNLSLEADSFNNVRQITVINAIQGDTLFQ